MGKSYYIIVRKGSSQRCETSLFKWVIQRFQYINNVTHVPSFWNMRIAKPDALGKTTKLSQNLDKMIAWRHASITVKNKVII